MNWKLEIPLILKSVLLHWPSPWNRQWRKIKNNTIRQTRCHVTFPIVNYPFISSNIPASLAYGVYISQRIRYSRACAPYSDFLDRAQLLTQKLLKQGYVAARLNSSLLKLYGRHHNLVNRYEMSISQMTMVHLLFT